MATLALTYRCLSVAPELLERAPILQLSSVTVMQACHRINVTHSAVQLYTNACRTIGVIYGDIGTSPLYVYASTFLYGPPSQDDVVVSGVACGVHCWLASRLQPLDELPFLTCRA